MSESERFQFGRLELPEDELPTPEELHNSIGDTFTDRKVEYDEERDEERVFKEKGRTSYLNDSHDEYGYCHFYYVADTESSVVVRDGDSEVETSQRELVRPRVLYFGNGQFAYETRDPLVEHWIPQFIGTRTETEVDHEDYSFTNRFDQDLMKYFYDRWDSITVFKFGAPETGEEFSSGSELGRALNELSEHVANQQFSGGQSSNNLKTAEIVQEAAEYMDIVKLHGKRDEDYTMNILASGTFKSAWSEKEWPDDAGVNRRAETIRGTLLPVLERV